jgi:predicted GNAT family N-acyltransferase
MASQHINHDPMDQFKEQLPHCFGKSDYLFALHQKEVEVAERLKKFVADKILAKQHVELAIRQYLYEHDIISDIQNSQTYAAIDFFYNQEFKIDTPSGFTENDLKIFMDLLRLQKKITKPTLARVKRCRYLAFCVVDSKVVSIGAIKPITQSVFGKEKANVPEYSETIDGELGYCFTLEQHRGQGYGSDLVKRLLVEVNNKNLMATTELTDGNVMIDILTNRGFVMHGKEFDSKVNPEVSVGLFLRISK